jgi:hypothetical protein
MPHIAVRMIDYCSFVAVKCSLPQIVVDMMDIVVGNIAQIGPIGMRMWRKVKKMQWNFHFVELFVIAVVVLL